MQKFKTIFFCGHESPYGYSHLEPLLTSQVLDVSEVVLASYERWNEFVSRLSGKTLRNSLFEKKCFNDRLDTVVQKIRSFKDCAILIEEDVNSKKNFQKVEKFDLAVSAAYPQIFEQGLIQAPRRHAVNFHPSLLPRCRGAHPIYWTIASQEPYGGVSCHVMTEKLDAGDIIAQRRIDFDPKSITYSELYQQAKIETIRLCKDVETFFTQNQTPVPQRGPVSYFRNDRDSDHKITFSNLDIGQISAKIRAGGAFALDPWGRKILFFPPVQILEWMPDLNHGMNNEFKDGTVLEAEKKTVVLMCARSQVKFCYSFDKPKSRILCKALRVMDLVVHNRRLKAGLILK